MNRTKALKLREMLLKAILSLDDSDALQAVELFASWQTNTAYEAGDRIRYNGQLYRCVQSHTSQESWTPDATPALWTEVAKPGEIPVWKQPTGAQDAYMAGDKVHYPTKEDPVYVNEYDNNIYAPDVWGWHLETNS